VRKDTNMPTYTQAVQKFAEKNCLLYTTEEEYKDMPCAGMKGIMRFRAVCGHNNTVTLTNFWYKDTGLNCKDCIKDVIRKKNSVSHTDFFQQEYEGIVRISSHIEDEFDIQRTNEGCLSDILIKPKYQKDDKWMMVQVKTTQDICHNLYTFAINMNDYNDCVILCICLKDDKMWVLDNTQVMLKNKLNIGVTEKSEYFMYQVKTTDLAESMHLNYALYNKFNKTTGVLPITIQQKQEQIYRRLRENAIPFIDFVYPNYESRVYDFTIKKYKIQEKVASIAKKSSMNPCYVVELSRHKTCYNKGDNDFYWVWKKKDMETFYIIPEDILVEYEYVQTDGNMNNKSKTFTLKKWTEPYKYSLSDKDLRQKMESIFGI